MSAAQKVENPLLDKNLVNAFVDGVKKTLSTMAMTESTPQKAFVERDFKAKGEVSGMIGMVAGNMRGTITISFEKPSIFKILENMLGEPYSEINEEVRDAVGELTNMIYGTAKTALNEMGYAFEMAIPTVITGSHEITSYHKGAALVIPFSMDENLQFFIEITVE
ncbi:MAG: chemotaxis protein CheX [Bdellovibrionota bacterium]|nr:chemotaxis protein CheX [Bdellovibrionota bacterium]